MFGLYAVVVRWLGILNPMGYSRLRAIRDVWRPANLVGFFLPCDLPSLRDVLRAVLLAGAVTAPTVPPIWLLQAAPMGALPKASESTALLEPVDKISTYPEAGFSVLNPPSVLASWAAALNTAVRPRATDPSAGADRRGALWLEHA